MFGKYYHISFEGLTPQGSGVFSAKYNPQNPEVILVDGENKIFLREEDGKDIFGVTIPQTILPDGTPVFKFTAKVDANLELAEAFILDLNGREISGYIPHLYFKPECSKYIRFNVSFEGSTPEGEGVFTSNTEEGEYAFIKGIKSHAFIGIDEVYEGEPYSLNGVLVPQTRLDNGEMGYRFIIDAGFYGEQEFQISLEGEEVLDPDLTPFYDGFNNPVVDEEGVCRHPITGMGFIPA